MDRLSLKLGVLNACALATGGTRGGLRRRCATHYCCHSHAFASPDTQPRPKLRRRLLRRNYRASSAGPLRGLRWRPSCRTGRGPHGTWRAMPAYVPQLRRAHCRIPLVARGVQTSPTPTTSRGVPTRPWSASSARAIEDYDTAINLDPNYADAYYGRGVAYYDLGELRRAIEDYDTFAPAIKPPSTTNSAWYADGPPGYSPQNVPCPWGGGLLRPGRTPPGH